MSRTIVAVASGLLAAAFAHFLALLLAGVGHGWQEPVFFSAALWITLPLIAIRLGKNVATSPTTEVLDWAMVVLGLVLDLLLVIATERGMFPMSPIGREQFIGVVFGAFPEAFLWGLFWFSWQIAAVLVLLRDLDRRKGVAD